MSAFAALKECSFLTIGKLVSSHHSSDANENGEPNPAGYFTLLQYQHGLDWVRGLHVSQASETIWYLCQALGVAFPDRPARCFERSPANSPWSEHSSPQAAVELLLWRPNIIVGDVSAFGVAEISEIFEIPLVVNSPSFLFTLDSSVSGYGSREASAHLPGWQSGFPRQMHFLQRCLNIIYPRLVEMALTNDFVFLNQLRSSLGLEPLRAQNELFGTKRVLINAVRGLEHPRFLSPLVDYVGPLLESSLASSVTAIDSRYSVMNDWLLEQRKNKRPIVVVSVGTTIGVIDSMLFESLIVALEGYSVVWLISNESNKRTSSAKNASAPVFVETRDSAEITKNTSRAINAKAVLAFVRAIGHRNIGHSVLQSYFQYCDGNGDGATDFDDRLCPNIEIEIQVGVNSKAEEDLVDDFVANQPAPESFFLHYRDVGTPLSQVLQIVNQGNEDSDTIGNVLVAPCSMSEAQQGALALSAILCIPLVGDHIDVAARVADRGIGVSTDTSSVSASDLRNLLDLMMGPAYNVHFRPALRAMRSLLQVPGLGTPHAAQLVEEALGHASQNQSAIFVPKGSHWPRFKAAMIDIYVLIWAFITLGISGVIFVTHAAKQLA